MIKKFLIFMSTFDSPSHRCWANSFLGLDRASERVRLQNGEV